MDATDVAILRELRTDARLSWAELGRRVHLSSPAVIERVRRLEAKGVIRGYSAILDPAKLGRPVTALIRLKTHPGVFATVLEYLDSCPEVIACDRVTGADCFVIRACLSSVQALEKLSDRLMDYGSPESEIVLSSPIQRSLAPDPESS